MKENINKPAIRFKGFDEAWEQRKLGEIVEITMGQSPSSKNYTDNPNDHILVQGNADIKNGRVIPRVWTTQVTKQAEKNDIILSVRAPVGDIGKTDYNIVLGRGVAGIKGNEFIFQLLFKMKENGYWKNLSTGSTFESINSNDIKEAYVLIPKNEEQIKIGIFFNNIDNLITLHQRKLNKLENLKKSMLEKMFPKNGEKTPEVRFEGFNNAWEQRKLGDIAGRYDNLRVPVTASNRIPGVTPYYGANGIQDYVDGFTHNGEFVLIAEDGANDLKNYPVHYVNGKVWVNNHAHVIQALEDISDNKFLKYSFKTLNIEPYLVGGGRAKLNANIMMDLVINTPTIKEQIKIGGVFSSLDNLITLHQRKVRKLENIKEAMLEKMFI